MIRIRLAAALSCVALGSLSSTLVARAQGGPAPSAAATSIPMAMDLKKVPVGSWATYRLGDGSGNTLSIKMVLVGRSAKGSEIETIVEGGPLSALGATVMRSSINTETGADANPKEHVIQMGTNPPMLIPMEMGQSQGQSFRKPQAKNKVGIESVTVPGGTFAHADHYQDKLPSGDVMDAWTSKDVPPFGLVKVKAGVDAQGKPVMMELMNHGAGAKAVITAKALPFDGAALMKQLQPMIAAQQQQAPAQAPAPKPGLQKAAAPGSAVAPSGTVPPKK